jgi:hypothetical protein
MKIPSLILLLVTLCSCSTQNSAYKEWARFAVKYQNTYHDTAPRFFWRGPEAKNGQLVLAAIRSGDAQSKTNVQALIGSQVVFVGEGVPRNGFWSDFEINDHIDVKVDVVPFEKVHPGPCGEYGVEVKGELESVDFGKRIICVKVKPENWKVTWQL